MSAANPLSHFSQAIEAQVAAAHGLAVAVRNSSHRHISATLWQPDAVVTSEQAVGDRDEYEVVTASGATAKARIAGRDPGTNLLVLRDGHAAGRHDRAARDRPSRKSCPGAGRGRRRSPDCATGPRQRGRSAVVQPRRRPDRATDRP